MLLVNYEGDLNDGQTAPKLKPGSHQSFLKECFLDWSLVCGQINTGAWHSINREHDKWQAVMNVVMTTVFWIFLFEILELCKSHI